jgi:hypothetical protein
MPKITELFAFICEEGPNDEGVMGASMIIPDVGPSFVPFVGADMKRIESLKPIADQISEQTKTPYKIQKFKLVEEHTDSKTD